MSLEESERCPTKENSRKSKNRNPQILSSLGRSTRKLKQRHSTKMLHLLLNSPTLFLATATTRLTPPLPLLTHLLPPHRVPKSHEDPLSLLSPFLSPLNPSYHQFRTLRLPRGLPQIKSNQRHRLPPISQSVLLRFLLDPQSLPQLSSKLLRQIAQLSPRPSWRSGRRIRINSQR